MSKTLHLLGRHQAAAIASTLVDFSTMTLLVELGGLSPAAATFVGAAGGGITNFMLGRRVFGVTRESGIFSQAVRYALVSGASAGLNALGVYLLVHAGVQYLLGRAAVALCVSLVWNFPMQRHFVFSPERDPAP
jgi:putative flippase GtrA